MIDVPPVVIMLVLLMVAATAFWVWMIVDCAGNDELEGRERTGWLLLVVLTHWVGALVYFLSRRPQTPQSPQRLNFEEEGWNEPGWVARIGDRFSRKARALRADLGAGIRSRPVKALVLAPRGAGVTSWLHALALAHGEYSKGETPSDDESAVLRVRMADAMVAATDMAHMFNPDAPTWPEKRLSRTLLRMVHSGLACDVDVERVLDFDDIPAFGAEGSEESLRNWCDQIAQADVLLLVIDPQWAGRDRELYRLLARHYRAILEGGSSMAGSWPYVESVLRALPVSERGDPSTVEASLRRALSLVLQSLAVPAADREAFLGGFAESVTHVADPDKVRDEYLDRIWELLAAAHGLTANSSGPPGTRYAALRDAIETQGVDPSLVLESVRKVLAPTMALPEAYERLIWAFADPDGVAPLARALRRKRLALVITKADRMPGFISACDAKGLSFSLVGDGAPVSPRQVRGVGWTYASKALVAAWNTRQQPWAHTLETTLDRLRPLLEPLLPFLGHRAMVFFVSAAESDASGGLPLQPVRPRGVAGPWLWALGFWGALPTSHMGRKVSEEKRQ